MEITLPVYIAGSIINITLWTLVFHQYKKFTRNQHHYNIVEQYEPQSEQAEFLYSSEKEPIV